MRPAFVNPGRRDAANVVLVAGYTVACWALARAVPMFRQRRGRRFVAVEAGTAAVALGWTLRGNSFRSAVNAALLALMAAVWWIGGRRRGSP